MSKVARCILNTVITIGSIAILWFLFSLFIRPSLAAQVLPGTVSLTVDRYSVTAVVSWTPMANACVYDVYVNGVEYDVPAKEATILTLTNLTGPTNITAYLRVYANNNLLSDFSAVTEVVKPVKAMTIGSTMTNAVIQKSTDLRSWVSIPGPIITNDGGRGFYRATSQWP